MLIKPAGVIQMGTVKKAAPKKSAPTKQPVEKQPVEKADSSDSEVKPLSRQEQLKKIAADKKVLNEQQKAIKDELNESKAERKVLRVDRSESRKAAKTASSELRELVAKIGFTFKEGGSEKINELADELVEVTAELAGHVRKFGETIDKLNEL